MATVQQGGIQTPTHGAFERWRFWWKHRVFVKRLLQGDVALDTIKTRMSRETLFRLMGELTSATGREVVLLRTSQGRVFRLGLPGQASVKGSRRVIAHTHPNGRIGLSPEDYIAIFLSPRRSHRSTIIVGPSGLWRRYTSNQEILGGNF